MSMRARRDGSIRRPRQAPIALQRIDGYRWRIPCDPSRGMRVDGVVFADDQLLEPIRDDESLQQVANVATLPGIVGASLAMPDVHWGYGFPVGGVAAMRFSDGVVSPGGIGFDINCGVRLLATDLVAGELKGRIERLADALFGAVPSGVGAHVGRRLNRAEMRRVLARGAAWVIEEEGGVAADLPLTEEGGRLPDADPDAVSARALERGGDQLGTLGSGNHFLEVETVDALLDEPGAVALGLRQDQVVVMIHCGSRGLGHQVCTDHVAAMDAARARYRIELPDRQLACAPIDSAEARAYFGGMAAAANFAWANRQAIAEAVRRVIGDEFGGARGQAVRLVYDVSHNIAKLERHGTDGREERLLVHRKGATRAFPAGHSEIPEPYRDVGQPVFIPGDMGRASYVAVGAPGAMKLAFGSTCHGAGRLLSRQAAMRTLRGVNVARQLAEAGIVVRAERSSLLAEEASIAYRDVSDVVRVAAGAGLITPVARLRPLAVIKG